MFRAVATVLVLVLVCGYLALFLSWNAAPQPVTGLQIGDSKYVQPMPVGLLFIAGVLVGAVAMAVALWAPWKALKAGELQQQELIQRAKSKLKAQDTKIKELTRQLEAKGGPAGPEDAEIDLPADTRAAVDAVEVEAGKAPEPKPAPAAEDDPEVI
jgi:type VI protein secretion system component VasK